jgi:arylsulfatase A-like enzyme
MHRLPLLLILLALSSAAAEDALLTSWMKDGSGRYARIFQSTTAESSGSAVTTWSRGQGIQSQPTYAGVHEVSSSANWVYIRTTGLGRHIMGPWYLNAAKTQDFPNFPANRAAIYRLPRNPTVPATKTLTGLGAIGYFIDGVAMFDNRDAFSYSNTNRTDATPVNGIQGDGIWNRDAYVNESVTFDAGNAHQAGSQYHYHANPPGLRHLLGDHVDYNAATNSYTENATDLHHSPILGWLRDGYPIYGPYGFGSALDAGSGVRRMISGYQRRDGSNGSTNLDGTGRTTLPAWAATAQNRSATLATNQYGPAVNVTYTLGHYLEDYDYKGHRGLTLGTDFDLDLYNGRFCVTPEFPAGTYAYFVSIEADGTPAFPYNIGRSFYGNPTGAAVTAITETVTVHFEGGPEMPDVPKSLSIDQLSGDVTLTWDGVEGGRYRIDASEDLDTWAPLGAATAALSDQPSKTDAGKANGKGRQFYRVEREGLNAFDRNGFSLGDSGGGGLTMITVTLAGMNLAPPDLNIAPTVVTFNGAPATFVIRPARDQVQIQVDLSGLAPGTYTVSATFPGPAGTQTGTYTVTGSEPVANNVLLIILDDWGIDASPVDNALPAATLANMPTLQSLASSGLRFTRAYAQPVCSPTRATMMTGRHPFRHGVGNQSTNSTLPTTETTLPEIFSAESSPYALASFGKWHLGNGTTGPSTAGGWDFFKGYLIGALPDYSLWNKIEVINGTATPTNNDTTYATTDQINDTVSWITAQGTTPWFCWLALTAPHAPFHEPPSELAPVGGYTAGGGNAGMYRRMLESMDTEMKRLLEGVDLAKTNVILMGDNGTPGQVVQAPFGAGHAKDSLFEGGIHVPLVISGPDVTVAPGTTSDKLVHCVDLFATVLELAGIDVPAATEGLAIDAKSLVPILKGANDPADRCVVSERFGSGAGDGRALISDDYPDYKLIIFGDRLSVLDTPVFEFYHLGSDENEQTPLNIGQLNATEQAAYDHLVAKDAALGGGYSDPA